MAAIASFMDVGDDYLFFASPLQSEGTVFIQHPHQLSRAICYVDAFFFLLLSVKGEIVWIL